MIKADQFTNIPDDLLFIFSSKEDGSVLDRARGIHATEMVENRRRICEQAGIRYDNVVYQKIVYSETSTYEVIAEVGQGSTTRFTPDVAADGLFTREVGVGLFLPVADCIVTLIYDPNKRYLALLHMGRHSTLGDLLTLMLQHFVDEGSDREDLQVWMAPSVTKAHYRLEYFDHANAPEWKGFVEKRDDGYHLDMQGFNRNVLMQAGVKPENIFISPIDTFENENYFSHYRGDTTGRFAGLTMMR